jgi:hypothetical protein
MKVCDACKEKIHNRLLARLQTMLRGQPKKYNWVQQNINGGHDQAIHAVARMIMGLKRTDPSPLKPAKGEWVPTEDEPA